ncbi:hypothetical protein [Nocardia sp. NPDC005745]|uniref:hypothetical protein n=1 Tax=Nocardia sp. NPDC005745 TaxID=3157061 RepID=UPI0034031779
MPSTPTRPSPSARAAFLDVTSHGLSFADAIEAGAASVSGDTEALRGLEGLFRLPPPRDRKTDQPSPDRRKVEPAPATGSRPDRSKDVARGTL